MPTTEADFQEHDSADAHDPEDANVSDGARSPTQGTDGLPHSSMHSFPACEDDDYETGEYVKHDDDDEDGDDITGDMFFEATGEAYVEVPDSPHEDEKDPGVELGADQPEDDDDDVDRLDAQEAAAAEFDDARAEEEDHAEPEDAAGAASDSEETKDAVGAFEDDVLDMLDYDLEMPEQNSVSSKTNATEDKDANKESSGSDSSQARKSNDDSKNQSTTARLVWWCNFQHSETRRLYFHGPSVSNRSECFLLTDLVPVNAKRV